MAARPPTIRLHAPPLRVRASERSLDELSSALVEKRVRDARESASSEGRRAGAREASVVLDRAVDRLEETRAALEEQATVWAVKFAVEIARHLVRREIAAGRHDVERLVRETLAQSGVGREACVVHLAPEDLAALEGVAFRAGTALEADPTVSRGEVHVTTAQGLFVREIEPILSGLLERLTREAL